MDSSSPGDSLRVVLHLEAPQYVRMVGTIYLQLE